MSDSSPSIARTDVEQVLRMIRLIDGRPVNDGVIDAWHELALRNGWDGPNALRAADELQVTATGAILPGHVSYLIDKYRVEAGTHKMLTVEWMETHQCSATYPVPADFDLNDADSIVDLVDKDYMDRTDDRGQKLITSARFDDN